MPELKNVVPDIYKLLDNLNNGVDITEHFAPHLDMFAANMKEAVEHWSVVQHKTGLRMSNIGRPDRRHWMDKNFPEVKEDLTAVKQINFLYGHILEQVLLLLVRAAGHTVENEQGKVEVEGIKGSMDSVIDGEVVDAKSASSFAFRKFVNGTLGDDDPFGYMAQLAGYEEGYGTNEGGFLVINKENGALCLHVPEDLDKPNASGRIIHLKEVIEAKEPPELCYEPIKHGEGGNMTVSRQCGWCPHKFECFKDYNEGAGLRSFQYKQGVEYFTKVVKEPRVQEIL